MKIKIIIITLIMIFGLVFGWLIICKNICINENLKYSQEYEIGKRNIKGEINILYYNDISNDFEIGANKYGYAVFKNPNKAFKTLKEKYKKGIKLIQKEFKLMPLSKFNFRKYKTYGWQVTTGSIEEKDQARFISSFIDIYENSYKIE